MPILMDVADRCSTITYAQLGERIGIHPHGPMTHVLELIYLVTEAMQLPPIWALVVSSETLRPNESVMHVPWDSSHKPLNSYQTWRAFVMQVHAYPWNLRRDEITERLGR
jgi:hypothetical protein